MAQAEQPKRRVQSIEVGFRVLRVLRTAEGPLPLREVAARADMPPSKAHLYLTSFVRGNMAYQDVLTGHYGLGTFAIQLGLAAVRQLDVVGIASEWLTRLRDKTDCATYLSLWGDQGPCIVAKEDGALQGAFAIRLGYILPVVTTGTGHVFLAHLPEPDTADLLEAQLAATGTPKAAVLEGIRRVRQEGYGSTVGMLHRNFAGVSAPVFDRDERIVAALTLLGPTDFMTRDRQERLRRLLLESTDAISRRLCEIGATAEGTG